MITLTATNISAILDIENLKHSLESVDSVIYAVSTINPGPNASVTFVNTLTTGQQSIAQGIIDSHVYSKTPTITKITSNLTVNKDLDIEGDNLVVNTTNMTVEDNIVTLNSGVTVPYVGLSGIEINRGTGNQKAQLAYDESGSVWSAKVNSGAASPLVTDSRLAAATITRSQIAAGTVGKFLVNATDGRISDSSALSYVAATNVLTANATETHIQCNSVDRIVVLQSGGTYIKADNTGAAGLFINAAGMTEAVPLYVTSGLHINIGSPGAYRSFLPGANYGSDTPVSLLYIDSGNSDTVLNSSSGENILFAENGTTRWTVSATSGDLIPTGTKNIGNSSNYISTLYTAALSTGSTYLNINSGSNSKYTQVSGGAAAGNSSGAVLTVSGNTSGFVGSAYLEAGNVANGNLYLKTHNATSKIELSTQNVAKLIIDNSAGTTLYSPDLNSNISMTNSLLSLTAIGSTRLTMDSSTTYLKSPDLSKYLYLDNGAAILIASGVQRLTIDSAQSYLRSPDALKWFGATSTGLTLYHSPESNYRIETNSTTTYLRSSSTTSPSMLVLNPTAYDGTTGLPTAGIEVTGGFIFPGTTLSMRAMAANTVSGQPTNRFVFYEGTDPIAYIDYLGFHTV